jgi:hypothetical protein
MQRSIKERNIKDRIIKDRFIKERHHRTGRNIGEGNLVAQIEMLAPWFHNLHFSGDIQTAPDHFLGDFPHYKGWQLNTVSLAIQLTGGHLPYLYRS